MDAPNSWALKIGAKAPLEWTDAHERVLRDSDTLWDDLRWVWIRARWLQDAAEDATGDAELLAARAALALSEAIVDAAFEARRQVRQRARSREVPAEIEQAITDAIEARRPVRTACYAAAKRVRATIRPQLTAIWQARDAACRAIAAGANRRYPHLHWAQTNDILARYTTAAREAAKKGRLVQPSRKHPSASMYVQLIARSVGGVRVERAGKRAKVEGGTLAGTTWAQLTAPGSTRAVRIDIAAEPVPAARAGRWGLLHLPIGDDLVVRLPVRIHRAPPAGALVKGVRVVRRGREWSAVFSVAGPVLTPIERGAGTVYVGVGWRQTRDGLRVLEGVDEAGVRVRVALPPEHMAAVSYSDLLLSALDRRAAETAETVAAVDPARAADLAELARRRDWRGLRDAIGAGPWADGEVPAKERHAALLAVRHAAGGDAEKQADGAARVLGDRAGRGWVEGMRGKAIRRREDLYGRAARWLVERYGRIVVAASDGRKLARVEAEDGQTTDLPLAARRQRQAAAPYSLLAAIRWAAARGGAEVVEVPAVDYSHTCPICGSEMERGKADRAALMLRCDAHGVWDRDHALALALWRDNGSPEDRERWAWHADGGQRSQAEVVRVAAELEGRLRGSRPAHSRLRYAAGVALARRPGNGAGASG